MKMQIRNFLLSASVLMLTCSFTSVPFSSEVNMAEVTLTTVPVGGAHLMFAGKNGGEITKKEMEGQSALRVDGCAAGAKILRYTLHITKSGKLSSLSAETASLNTDMMAALRSLSVGDYFEFRQVKARLLDSQDIVDVGSSRFVVVEKKV
jgi:hypothetical protein